jgi:hypothetical protein
MASETDKIERILARVDWNFPGSSTPDSTVHSLHWFPGNFIPQIPSYLIRLLSVPGDVVLDPFCGSGTTGVEAVQLGRKAWLSDVNRAGIQVTKGKIAAEKNPQLYQELQDVFSKLVWEGMLRSDQTGLNNEGTDQDLIAWFHVDTLSQLRCLWTFVEAASSNDLRSVLEVIFSDTLFACASTRGAPTSTGKKRRHHWGWIADNVRPKHLARHNAIKIFRDKVLNAIHVLQQNETSLDVPVTILREDARKLSVPSSSVDLVVTSPPYLGMIDYTLANRLTYLWMGWPLKEDRDMEIGARYTRNRRQAESQYIESISASFLEICRSLRNGGYCAIVIGDSKRFPGMGIRVVGLLHNELEVIWGPHARTPTRRRVSDREGREPTEWVCVLRK